MENINQDKEASQANISTPLSHPPQEAETPPPVTITAVANGINWSSGMAEAEKAKDVTTVGQAALSTIEVPSENPPNISESHTVTAGSHNDSPTQKTEDVSKEILSSHVHPETKTQAVPSLLEFIVKPRITINDFIGMVEIEKDTLKLLQLLHSRFIPIRKAQTEEPEIQTEEEDDDETPLTPHELAVFFNSFEKGDAAFIEEHLPGQPAKLVTGNIKEPLTSFKDPNTGKMTECVVRQASQEEIKQFKSLFNALALKIQPMKSNVATQQTADTADKEELEETAIPSRMNISPNKPTAKDSKVDKDKGNNIEDLQKLIARRKMLDNITGSIRNKQKYAEERAEKAKGHSKELKHKDIKFQQNQEEIQNQELKKQEEDLSG